MHLFTEDFKPTKKCRDCGERKPLGDYYKGSKSKGWVYGWCKACHLIRHAVKRADPEWRAKRNARDCSARKVRGLSRPLNHKVRNYSYGLKSNYGITLGQRIQLSERHGGRCWITGDLPTDGKMLVVDHDHRYELGDPCSVRGLLTQKANTWLLFLTDLRTGEKVEVWAGPDEYLESAMAYIRAGGAGLTSEDETVDFETEDECKEILDYLLGVSASPPRARTRT